MESDPPASLSDHDEPVPGSWRGVKGPIGPGGPCRWSEEPGEHAPPQCWPEEPEEPDAPCSWAKDRNAPLCWPEKLDSRCRLAKESEEPNAPSCWPRELDALYLLTQELEESDAPSYLAQELEELDASSCLAQELEEPNASSCLAQELEGTDTPNCLAQELEGPNAPSCLAQELERPIAPSCWPEELEEPDAPSCLAQELEEPDASSCLARELEKPDAPNGLAQELEEPDASSCWREELVALCLLTQGLEEPDAPSCLAQELEGPDTPSCLAQELEVPDALSCLTQELEGPNGPSCWLEELDALCLLAQDLEEPDSSSCLAQDLEELDAPSCLAQELEGPNAPSCLAQELEGPNAPSCWPEELDALCLLAQELEKPDSSSCLAKELGEPNVPSSLAKEPGEPDTLSCWPEELNALCGLAREPEGPDALNCLREELADPDAFGCRAKEPEKLDTPCCWAEELEEPDSPRCWSEDPDARCCCPQEAEEPTASRLWPQEPYVPCLWLEEPNATRCWPETDAPCLWLQSKEPEEPRARCSWPEDLEDCGSMRALPLRPSGELLQACPGPPSDPSSALLLPSEPRTAQEEGARLRAVFDALDSDGDGFVRIEDFIQFATVYGAEQVKDLTQYLDPSGLGVISFEDFHQGIMAIRNGDPDGQLYSVEPAHDEEPPACADEFDDFVTYEANEVTDSAYMGSESTYSECETFTDEDTSTLVHPELQPEGDADSAGGSAVPSECLDTVEEPDHGALLLLPGRSHPSNQTVVMVIGGEEHFEDYGEGNEAELSPETLCNGELDCGDPAFLTPSSDPLATKLRSILTDEAFEFYCSQCHKQINRLEDLSARLTDLEMNSPAKRLSSRKVARYLHQSGALTMEALEDSPPEPVEGPEEDIADKVVFLERRVSELEKDSAAAGEQHSRLRQENLQLVHRANALEEQLKEQELRAQERVLEETRKQKELLCKMEREKSIEIENLQTRLQQLDEENSELRSCTPCLKANIERLEEFSVQEKQKMLDEIEELSLRLNEEQENKRKMGDKLSHERHQFQRDKEATQELIEDLRKQLEHLQLLRLEAEQRRGRSSSLGLQEYNSRARESELEQEVRRLKQDNRNLKEQNDELNGQIITLSIQGAKSLFSTSFSESLAAEISSVSRDELMEAIQKQEEINFRLQDYIDRIIVAILETNPSILEVK
ncbi:rab11 family-interacting protein 3 isoform X3 [Nannospalax galili]|uniref:rab11 family-interacting protein 3 isoform X3 n=1 Tax=Nannospalax galili TaxID=1026970 RepID=UPI0004ED07C9|nr:rab11 family-interacting protein 3 isoform X3 [Nannospalax galili]